MASTSITITTTTIGMGTTSTSTAGNSSLEWTASGDQVVGPMAGLITASMIVRDEAAVLPECLKSIRSVVDDIVVIDTGSVDNTPDIAREFGAHVDHRPWTDNFADARNAALDHSDGDWILCLDPDERLAPVKRSTLVELLTDAPEMAFRLLLRPYAHMTPYREYRLWRNDPRIRFKGVIHETVVPSIHAAAAADHRPIGVCDLLLTHLGYEGDQTRKHHRNLPLLQKQLKADPEHLFGWHHLARVRAGLGEVQEAERILAHTVELARAQPSVTPWGVLAYADLIAVRHRRGEDVTELLAEARHRYPHNYLLLWHEAQVFMAAGRYAEAVDRFTRLLTVDTSSLPDEGPAYDKRLFGEFAHDGRALCLFHLGQYTASAAAYTEAARYAPDNPAYPIKRELALARSGRQVLAENAETSERM